MGVVLVLLYSLGCSDYGLKYHPPGDTGPGEDPGPILEEEESEDLSDCVHILELYEGVHSGMDETDRCRLTSTDNVSFGATVTSLRVLGLDGTPEPTGYDIQVHGDENDTNPFDSWPVASNYYTNLLSSTSLSDGSWEAPADSTDINNIASCGACDYDIMAVEIYDTSRVAPDECWEYLLPGLYVCFEGPSSEKTPAPVRAKSRVPINSSCVAGSGRFQLAKTRWANRDEDGNETLVFRPIQISGTGAMTAAARITRLSSVNDWGGALKIIRGNNSVAIIDENDMLQAVVGQVATVTTTELVFMGDSVRGGTPFVLEEHQETVLDPNIQVDMEWTCSPPLPIEEAILEQGYTISFAEMGCLGNWNQKMTLRPSGSGLVRQMSIEAYGFTDFRRKIPLVTQGNQSHFYALERGFEVEGDIISESPVTGMVVSLTKADFLGTPLCQLGQYTLPIE